MGGEAPGGTRRESLAKSLDGRSSFFLFGYYLQALESLGGPAGTGLGRELASDAAKLLERLRDTASRCAGLEFLVPEISDVQRLLAEKGGGAGKLPDDLVPFLGRLARRWFQRVRELPRKGNSLAVDIAFNLELAGYGELASDLFEAVVCAESGAFRACRLMSRLSLEKALAEAGFPEGALDTRLERAKGAGLITQGDLRPAVANFGELEGAAEEEAATAEWALETALRLAKKLLRAELQAGLLRAMALAPGAKLPD